MSTYLNTEITDHGVAMTFEDGSDAGLVRYNSNHTTLRPWQHIGPTGINTGPHRHTREAAQFDALAWAAENISAALELHRG